MISIIAVLLPSFYSAQTDPQTVGVFQNSEESLDGYTLVAANGSNQTYLMDNCGFEVNTWESEFKTEWRHLY